MASMIRVMVIHSDGLEVRQIYNDLVGWRYVLGDFPSGVRTIPLTAEGDLLVVNEGGRSLLLPTNPLAEALVEVFHPGFVAWERLHGPAFLATAAALSWNGREAEDSMADVRPVVAEFMIRTARQRGLPVGFGPEGLAYGRVERWGA